MHCACHRPAAFCSVPLQLAPLASLPAVGSINNTCISSSCQAFCLELFVISQLPGREATAPSEARANTTENCSRSILMHPASKLAAATVSSCVYVWYRDWVRQKKKRMCDIWMMRAGFGVSLWKLACWSYIKGPVSTASVLTATHVQVFNGAGGTVTEESVNGYERHLKQLFVFCFGFFLTWFRCWRCGRV